MASVFSPPDPVDVDGELVLLLPRREEEGGAAAVAVEGGGGPHVVLPEGVPVQLGGDSIDIRNLIKARLRVHVKAGVKDAFRKAPDKALVKSQVKEVKVVQNVYCTAPLMFLVGREVLLTAFGDLRRGKPWQLSNDCLAKPHLQP